MPQPLVTRQTRISLGRNRYLLVHSQPQRIFLGAQDSKEVNSQRGSQPIYLGSKGTQDSKEVNSQRGIYLGNKGTQDSKEVNSQRGSQPIYLDSHLLQINQLSICLVKPLRIHNQLQICLAMHSRICSVNSLHSLAQTCSVNRLANPLLHSQPPVYLAALNNRL